MFYFRKRSDARTFAGKAEHYKAVDCGTSAPIGRRWAVKVL